METVLEKLCLGFVEDEAATEYSAEKLQEIYRNAIYLLYRILFLFYAEARGLLPIEDPAYRSASLAALVETAWQQEKQGRTGTEVDALWKRLTRLFVVVDDGDQEFGVAPYNGGLFSDSDKPYLKGHRIHDGYLAPVLCALGYEEAKSGSHLIDYRDLSVRHLGTLYEGFLEWQLKRVADEPRVLRVSGGKRAYIPQSIAGVVKRDERVYQIGEVFFASDDKDERKESGSYYTPEDVVQYIVGNTVTPKLEERRKSFDMVREDVERNRTIAATPEERLQLERYADRQALETVEQQILSLRILDLAMGSGHFLVASAQRVTDFIVELLNATDWQNDEISTDPILWKRRAVERCIYGVDKNPLAHELAKLSLWIASASAGKPLTFLDPHLKCGNSLYGAPLTRLSSLPHEQGKRPQGSEKRDDPLFRMAREKMLLDAVAELSEVRAVDSDTIAEVKHKEAFSKRVDEKLERLKLIADLWLATLFGLKTEHGKALSDAEYDQYLHDLTSEAPDDVNQAQFQSNYILQQAHRIAEREEFFHWELEFPDSVINGECRFDAIVKNPPYVGTKANAAITALYETAKCGDLYAWLFEKALLLTQAEGNVGTVVPLSLMFSRDFKALRASILKRKGMARFANFDIRPAAIFGSPGEPNSQRATIALLQGGNDELRLFTTNLLRWGHEERPRLLTNLRYGDVTEFMSEQGFPKIGDLRLTAFLSHLRNENRTLRQICKTILGEGQKDYQSEFFLIVPRAVRYFLSAIPVHMDRNKVLTLTFSDADDRDLATVLLNSNIHYWYWNIVGDGFVTNVDTVATFPAPNLPIDETRAFADRIFNVMDECATSHGKLGEKVPSFNFNKRMDVLLDIDEWIVKHVAPDLNLPRDIFAQYKSNSFLRPHDLSALTGEDNEEGE